MGRGKKKRKKVLKIKRNKKRKKGKVIPFSLNGNYNYKVHERANKHDLKTNVHKIVYKKAKIQNVKFTASNITKCKFTSSTLIGVDFINTNLKNSDFKNANLKHVIFFGANLKDVDFKNATFNNTYFINCNLKHTKNLDLFSNGLTVLNGSINLNISSELEQAIFQLHTKSKFSKHYILTTKNSNGKKINNRTIYILLQHFTSKELTNGLTRLFINDSSTSNKHFITTYSYLDFLCRYYKKSAII